MMSRDGSGGAEAVGGGVSGRAVDRSDAVIAPEVRTQGVDPLHDDPLHDDPRVIAYFGDRYLAVRDFATRLADQGILRGLIGPRELSKVWERHILNSAALVPFLPPGTLIDVGSGAGLPGVVIAAMQPERPVVLVEPMDRRTAWLIEVTQAMGLDNVTVVRGRAEEVEGSLKAAVVTARAVASVDKLIKWCAPLLEPHGQLVLLKGRSATEELERAKYALRKHGFTGEAIDAPTIDGVESTVVVRLTR